ncbi:hypothetical protein ACLKA7_015374 [Drosophila subpalustris]
MFVSKFAKQCSQQRQQRLPWRRRITTATTNAAQLVIFNSLLFLLLSTVTQAHPQPQEGASLAAAHIAALAAPGPVAGPGPIPGPGSPSSASSGSSILDQFSPNCTAVTHIFQARGIDANEIPQKPSNDGNCILRPPAVDCCQGQASNRHDY